ncbi:MAG TPA: AMP nucleosidase [Turneriella sp.]|nr:AMP nucleosidase [Turneriella sp.]HNE20529.1 AMP nucleosidase [Turneriella sp.]HNJ65549.1 AMP nucleosidase [Turneriella sp.]HNN00700.1 AMP nucleosidase [Turneriella sp.]
MTVDAASLLTEMRRIHDAGKYSLVEVTRPWSKFNPTISGEFAHPAALEWYLKREFTQLLQRGAQVRVTPARTRRDLFDPELIQTLSEDEWDLRKKKLFLFAAERIELSLNRLTHYTSTQAESFQRYILFTNYRMHVDAFLSLYPDCIKPSNPGAQMAAYHHVLPDHAGITLINIGVGPANAKTITDHVAVLRPDLMIMVGHCGGLRNHQDIGDYVLASAYMRADRVMEEVLPNEIPVIPNFLINSYLRRELAERKIPYRMGTVYTTDNRNWEFNQRRTIDAMKMSRSIAVDMESATIAANGYRYRIPHATLLCVSDKPLHGRPKLSNEAQAFYANSKERHLEVAIKTVEAIRSEYPQGLPNDDVRSFDEPLLGSSGND